MAVAWETRAVEEVVVAERAKEMAGTWEEEVAEEVAEVAVEVVDEEEAKVVRAVDIPSKGTDRGSCDRNATCIHRWSGVASFWSSTVPA